MGTAFASAKVGRGAAYADIDNDGALDVLVTTNGGRPWLFHNEGQTNHSLRIKLVGTKSNRDGIGAVVRVTSGGAKQWQMLRSGSSYLSASELVLTFGLGSATKADAVEISGPAGRWRSFPASRRPDRDGGGRQRNRGESRIWEAAEKRASGDGQVRGLQVSN